MSASEIAEVFAQLPRLYKLGKKAEIRRVFYFSLGEDEKWTVTLDPDQCRVQPGKAAEADCVVKTSPQMFLNVWNGRHTPSPMDFLTGAIQSNDPMMLKEFAAAFGKS